MRATGAARGRSAVVAEGLKRLAGVEPLRVTVRGSSMEPRLGDGIEVWVAPRRLYLPGDILAFRSPDGQIVVHRLLGFAPLRGRVRIVTRGDARRGIDSPAPGDAVIGRVVRVAGEDRRLEVPVVRRLGALASFVAVVLRNLLGRRPRG